MTCNICNKNIAKTELSINEREELEYLREWRKREEDHLKKLVSSPVYKKYIDMVPIHGMGCSLNFT